MPGILPGVLSISLQSGSAGNCIFVEAGDVRLLFDAGISGRQAARRLALHGRDIRSVNAVLLSHCHGDHTRCTGTYHRAFDLPIYGTAGTLRVIRPYIGKLRSARTFAAGASLNFGDVVVHTIPTPHDAPDAVAFVVEHGGRRLGILTDLGHVFDQLRAALGQLDAVYLESNHDPVLLAASRYPPDIKARIAGSAGHLSNDEAAGLVYGNGGSRLQWVALAHLSGENNTPELALDTHRAVLGSRYRLAVAPRDRVGEVLRVE